MQRSNEMSYLENLVGSLRFQAVRTMPATAGATHYFDTVRRTDSQAAAVCKGLDSFSRPFVSFRVTVLYNPSRKVREEDVVCTVFQRYTEEESIFVNVPFTCDTQHTRVRRSCSGYRFSYRCSVQSSRSIFFRERGLVDGEYTCILVEGVAEAGTTWPRYKKKRKTRRVGKRSNTIFQFNTL